MFIFALSDRQFEMQHVFGPSAEFAEPSTVAFFFIFFMMCTVSVSAEIAELSTVAFFQKAIQASLS